MPHLQGVWDGGENTSNGNSYIRVGGYWQLWNNVLCSFLSESGIRTVCVCVCVCVCVSVYVYVCTRVCEYLFGWLDEHVIWLRLLLHEIMSSIANTRVV